MDGLNGLILKQLLIVRIDLGTFNAEFFRRFNSPLLNDIAESHHLSLVYLFERRHMLAVGDAAAADDAYSYLSFHQNNSCTFYCYIGTQPISH